MKCGACNERFQAGYQMMVGGQAAPGVFLIVGTAATLVGFAFFFLGGTSATFAYAVVAWLIASGVLVQVPIAMGDSKSMGVAGRRCPRCEHVNPVRPWSL